MASHPIPPPKSAHESALPLQVHKHFTSVKVFVSSRYKPPTYIYNGILLNPFFQVENLHAHSAIAKMYIRSFFIEVTPGWQMKLNNQPSWSATTTTTTTTTITTTTTT